MRNLLFAPLFVAALFAPARLHAEAAAPGSAPDRRPQPTIEDSLRRELGRAGGLTSDQVAARAAVTSFDVRAREKEVSERASEMDKALVGWFPRLTLTARYTRLSPITASGFGPSDANLVGTPAGEGPLPPGAPLIGVPASAMSFPVILNQYALQAALVVPVSDYLLRTSQSYAAAARSRRAAELNARAARLGAALSGRVIYYGWARAVLQRIVAERTLAQSNAHLDAARAAFDAERVSRADVLRAESQAASSELLVERAGNLVEVATEQLRTVMHDESARRYEIGEALLAPLPRLAAGEFPRLYQEALAKRLEIRALDETAWSLREQRRAVSAGNYPRLDAFADAAYANPNQRYVPQEERWRATWDVGLQVTWTPNELGTSRAGASALDAQVSRLEAEKAALRDALRSEVMQSYQDVRSAQVAVDTTRRSLDAAEEGYRVRAEQYKYGRATNLELIDAEAELLRARLELIGAHLELRIARAKLEHAVGRDVR